MQQWDNGASLCDRQFMLLQGGQCYSGNENIPFQPKEENSCQANPAENLQESLPQGNGGSFECKHCNRTFSTKRYLQRHIIIHRDMEQESLSCQLCGRNFTSKAHLDRHKFIHTGQRPFQCNVCGRSFGRKDHLQKHVATLHDENRATNSKTPQNAGEGGAVKQPPAVEENRTKVPSGSVEQYGPKLVPSIEDDSSLSSGTPTVDECRKRLPSSSLDDFGSTHSSSMDTPSSSMDDYRNPIPLNSADDFRNSQPSNVLDDFRSKPAPGLVEDYRSRPSSSLTDDYRHKQPGSLTDEHRSHFSMNYYNEVPFQNHSIRPNTSMYGAGAENFYHYKSSAVDYPGVRKPDPVIPSAVHEDSLPLYMYLREQLDFNKQATNFRHGSQDYMFNGSEIVSALHHLNGDVPSVHEHMSPRSNDSRDYAKMNNLLHYDRKAAASELYLDSANANCSECGLKFFNPAALKQHVCIPVAEKIFRCVSCNMIFADAVALEGHRQPIECSECCTIFSSGCDLEHHKCIPQQNFSNR